MIYLNNAATSFPKPEAVLEAVNAYCRRPPFSAERSGAAEQGRDILARCRENLCRLFNIDSPDHVIFTSGATHSLNLVLRGLLKRGDHVVTTQTEHNSVLRLVKTLEKREGIFLTIVPCNKNGWVDPGQMKACLLDHTRLVVVNHCSNVTGSFQDIIKIGTILKKHRALFVVDAAQSAGAAPIDVAKAEIDVLVFAGHKSLFGFQGTGGVYIREGIDPDPLIIGGTGVKSDYLFQPPGRPGCYEAGTLNVPGIVSLNAGVEYILKTGIQTVRQKKAALKTRLLEFFLNQKNIVVYGGSRLEDFSGTEAVVGFNIKGFPAEDTGYILEKSFDIICRSGLHCAPLIHQALGSYPEGCVRVSFSPFNTRKDVDGLIDAVSRIVQSR